MINVGSLVLFLYIKQLTAKRLASAMDVQHSLFLSNATSYFRNILEASVPVLNKNIRWEKSNMGLLVLNNLWCPCAWLLKNCSESSWPQKSSSTFSQYTFCVSFLVWLNSLLMLIVLGIWNFICREMRVGFFLFIFFLIQVHKNTRLCLILFSLSTVRAGLFFKYFFKYIYMPLNG